MAARPSSRSQPLRRRPYAPRLPAEQRREQLLDAALALIVERGYAGVTIEAVARIAGVTRPVVYDHFPNLGRLLHALVEREERIALSQLDRAVPGDPGRASPAELVLQGVERFLEAVLSRPNTWRIILLPTDGTPSIIREQVEAGRARIQARIARLVQRAVGLPGVPDELDVELAARSIRVLGEEAGRMVLTDPEHCTPLRVRRFVQAVMTLMWPREPSDLPQRPPRGGPKPAGEPCSEGTPSVSKRPAP
jgi:AcrR family transcriptional regulator